jgi:ATP-binding cassette subfamily F protein uup
MGIQWKENQRVIDVVKEIAEVVEMKNGRTISASQFLEHFMFTPESQYKLITKLSGGELRRLHLLTVLIKNPNFLILDEPTNDLDLFALNRLEEFLLAYEGCLVIVSHDRYFLDKLTDHLFIFEGEGRIRDHYGKYSDYRMEMEVKRPDAKVPEVAGAAKEEAAFSRKKNGTGTRKDQKKTRLSFREQQEYDSLEGEIELLERERAAIEMEMNAGLDDYEELHRKSQRVSEIIGLVDQKMQRWMELASSIEPKE